MRATIMPCGDLAPGQARGPRIPTSPAPCPYRTVQRYRSRPIFLGLYDFGNAGRGKGRVWGLGEGLALALVAQAHSSMCITPLRISWLAVFLATEIFGDSQKLLKRVLQVFDDAGCDLGRWGEVVGPLQALVAQPEEVEAELVAFEQFFVAEGAETFALLTLVAILSMIAGDKIVEVAALELVGTQGEVHVGTQIVDPESLGLHVGAGLALVEEEDVGFDALRVKDAGGQAQEGMHIAALQQVAPNRFARSSLEKDVVGDDDRRTTAGLEQAIDVLHKIELLIAGRGPEVVAADGRGLLLLRAVAAVLFAVAHQAEAALAAKGRIGEDDIKFRLRPGAQAIDDVDRRLLGIFIADAVQKHVHDAEPRGAIDDLPALERLVLEKSALFARHAPIMTGNIVMRGQQEAAGAARRIADFLHRPGLHHIDDGLDQGAGRKILARAAFGILGVLLQQPFVGVALDIGHHL